MTTRIRFRAGILLAAVGLLAACGSDSTSTATTVAPTTSAAAAATTTAAADTGAPDYQIPASLPATTTASTTGASLALRDDPTLGPILVDAEGFTLYLFTKDTGTTSVCTGDCLAAWPPAVANGTPTVGDGLDAGKLTVSPQADGTQQLTYNGHLLYSYAPDKSPGDTTGQAVGGVWFTLDAQGNQVGGETAASTPAGTTATSASLALRDDPTLGPILVDAEGFTLYLFTKDTGTTSACTGGCAANWPAATVTGSPTAGDGIDASKLAASAQPDGSMQLTYNGHLLYRFAGDLAAGDTKGQDVNDVWYALDAQGDQVGE